MKIQELRELLSSNKDLREILPIKKKYISFLDKRDLVLNIPFYAIRENIEGFKERDRLFEDMIVTVLVSTLVLELDIEELYETVEIDGEDIRDLKLDVAIELYDLLQEYEVFDYVKAECYCVMEIMDYYDAVIESRIECANSFGGIIKSMLGEFLSKMPDTDSMTDIANKLPEMLNGIEPERLKLIAGALGVDAKTPKKKTTTKKSNTKK